MSNLNPEKPFVFAHSPEGLIELGMSHVRTGRALAALMHNSFTIEDCPQISFAAVNLLSHKRSKRSQDPSLGESYESNTLRRLPFANLSTAAHGEDQRLLPPFVLMIANQLDRRILSRRSPAMPIFYYDEFRRPHSPPLMHADASSDATGLNTHVTAHGNGRLFMIDAGYPNSNGHIFTGREEHERLMRGSYGPVYDTPLSAGTVAILPSFENPKLGIQRKIHGFSSDSDLRVSVAIDQPVFPLTNDRYTSDRFVSKLADVGIDATPYLEAWQPQAA